MTRRIALDLEATHTTDEPDFDRPETWRVFAISLAFDDSSSDDSESVVLVRRDGSDRERRQLFCAMANWIRERAPHDVVLSYNGDSFDFPIIEHNIEEIEAQDADLAGFVRSQLDVPHRDLFKEICERQPDDEKWPSLSESLDERSISAPVATLSDRVVDGGAMPALGERILSGGGLTDEERDALVRYSKSDVEPLLELAGRLDRECGERIAMEADAVTGRST